MYFLLSCPFQVSTIQMQQVLALECLITAYSMSALYLDGVTKGENQMMATGILLMFASLAFSCTLSLSLSLSIVRFPPLWWGVWSRMYASTRACTQ